MKIQHTPTPTPWVTYGWKNSEAIGIQPEHPDGVTGPIIVDTFKNGLTPENAAFIVKAVNAHQELISVVKEALCHLDPDCEYDGANANGKEVSEYAKLVIAMYEAIAKAEGQTELCSEAEGE